MKMARATEAERVAYRRNKYKRKTRDKPLTAWANWHPAFAVLVRNMRRPGDG